jgi:hypothetical protein
MVIKRWETYYSKKIHKPPGPHVHLHMGDIIIRESGVVAMTLRLLAKGS